MNWIVVIHWIKENWQYIVPVAGFLGAIFVYVAHDRNLKKLQIKQLKEEQDKKKQAEIKCNAYTHNANANSKVIFPLVSYGVFQKKPASTTYEYNSYTSKF